MTPPCRRNQGPFVCSNLEGTFSYAKRPHEIKIERQADPTVASIGIVFTILLASLCAPYHKVPALACLMDQLPITIFWVTFKKKIGGAH